MDIIVLNTSKVELIKESGSVLHVNVVVGNAVHNQEADVLRQRLDIADAGIVIPASIILGCMHVSLGVDRICQK